MRESVKEDVGMKMREGMSAGKSSPGRKSEGDWRGRVRDVSWLHLFDSLSSS